MPIILNSKSAWVTQQGPLSIAKWVLVPHVSSERSGNLYAKSLIGLGKSKENLLVHTLSEALPEHSSLGLPKSGMKFNILDHDCFSVLGLALACSASENAFIETLCLAWWHRVQSGD